MFWFYCMTYFGIRDAVKKVVDELSLENVSVYSFKHTFATRLGALGVNGTVIGALLGHTSPPEGLSRITFRYIHPQRHQLFEAVIMLEREVAEVIQFKRENDEKMSKRA